MRSGCLKDVVCYGNEFVFDAFRGLQPVGDLRTGELCANLRVLVTARASAFCISCSPFS